MGNGVYIISIFILTISSVVYSYGALLSCFADGFTVSDNFTLVANILYVVGYLFDMIGEIIKFVETKRGAKTSEYLIIHLELDKKRSKAPVILSRLSSVTFIISSGVYTILSIYTCMTDEWSAVNITTLVGNSLYTIGCSIVTVNDFMKKDSDQNSLMNRMTLPILQHLDFVN